MAKVREGMAEAEVIALLGKPDDIRTHADPGGITTTHTRDIWRYGTDGHLTFPTLGQVYFTAAGTVQYTFGSYGTPTDPALVPEPGMRSLLRLLDKVPSYNDGQRYDPLAVIRAVNALQPLGKAEALAVVDEYLRVASHFHNRGREGVCLVLRVLYDVPADPGYLPRMRLGSPLPGEPRDPEQMPRFPVWLQGDVPLLVVRGYEGSGFPEPPERYVAYFRTTGRFRDKPLTPTDDPCAVMDAWLKLPPLTNNVREHRGGQAMAANQLLTMLDSVYRPGVDGHGERLSSRPDGPSLDERWATTAAAIRKLGIRWDRAKQRYTFKDGTHLPDR